MNKVLGYPIKIFVFGTLRKGGKLDYYIDGSQYTGKYYTEGQLMMSEVGSAYIDFEQKGVATIGELHYINLAGLLRINHLESRSGEFPKGYDLDIVPIWEFLNNEFSFDKSNITYAFFYKRRNEPQKINSGDWINRCKPLKEIKKYLKKNKNEDVSPEKLISYMLKYLKK